MLGYTWMSGMTIIRPILRRHCVLILSNCLYVFSDVIVKYFIDFVGSEGERFASHLPIYNVCLLIALLYQVYNQTEYDLMVEAACTIFLT
jgi:hypothetical protein